MSDASQSEELFPTSYVGTVPFASTNLQRATSFVIDAAVNRLALPIRLSNAYCVALAGSDRTYRELLNGNGVNFPDGTPVIWFMRRRGAFRYKSRRVRGPSLFGEVLCEGRRSSLTHFFLGTERETLSRLVHNVNEKYPGILVSGTYAPPFAPVTDAFIDDCAKEVERAGAHVVWVALGTPKQDYVADELARRTSRPCLGVGAAFDFHAGTVREAPEWVQRSGIEWLYRLSQDPRRLWKRYLIGNVQFLYQALTNTPAAR